MFNLSLNRVYEVLTRNEFLYKVAYWLAAPTLLIVQALGCGKEPFNGATYQIDRAYYSGGLPGDPVPYDEYLLVLKYIYEVMEVEVRDAQFA